MDIKGMKAILCFLMAIVALQLLGDNLIDVVNEAELHIERTYKGEMARRLAIDKLQKIVLDEQKTDKEKMDTIRLEFLAPKKEEKLTEANAYHLIWIPPLSWDIHSIAIAYNLERSQTQVISAETVDSKKASRTKSNENGGKSSFGELGSTGLTTDLGYQTKISLVGMLTARPQFEIQARGSYKKDWDESKTELWSKSRQEQLTSNFEELTKDIRSTQVSRCHLSFAIDFQNNCDEDLMFSASSTVPVYMGTTLVLNAMPENIGNSQMFTVPRKAVATIKFRGEIDTTQAYKLLEYMKTNAPTILPEKGQITIFSANNKVKNAIQESLAIRHSVIRCGEYEWKVRSTWNDKCVTLWEALWAVNSLYEKGPFDIENDTCTTMFGQFRCGPYLGMAEAEVYPIAEIDGKFFSRLNKEQLDGRLSENGVCFHMGSIDSYTNSNDYAPQFYELLLKDLLSVEGQDENGEIKNFLGYMYAIGKGTSKDMSEAVKWYRKAAEQGYAKAQCNLGNCYYCGNGVLKDVVKAVEWYRKAAEQGIVEAQCSLGWVYEHGDGVTKDMTEAVKWWRKAAEQGEAWAQNTLGWAYKDGDGVTKDMTEAVKWWRKAAEQGNTEAQRCLGISYECGEGVTKDMVKAVEWYRKAAEHGNVEAQCNLGDCYALGNGVEMDKKKAMEWCLKAAGRGHAKAQFTMGWHYDNGVVVEKDMTEAVKWYRKAAAQGDDRAIKRLQELNQ